MEGVHSPTTTDPAWGLSDHLPWRIEQKHRGARRFHILAQAIIQRQRDHRLLPNDFHRRHHVGRLRLGGRLRAD